MSLKLVANNKTLRPLVDPKWSKFKRIYKEKPDEYDIHIIYETMYSVFHNKPVYNFVLARKLIGEEDKDKWIVEDSFLSAGKQIFN